MLAVTLFSSLDGPRISTRKLFVGTLLLICTFVHIGCSTQRFVTARQMPLNPLAGQLDLTSKKGPQVSGRTLGLLRKYDLLDAYNSDTRKCLDEIQHLAETEPECDIIYSISELSYILGKRYEKDGEVDQALDMYGISVSNAYMYLFAPALDVVRNEYDPRFRFACDLYNESLESTLRIVNARKQLVPGNSYQIKTQAKEYEVGTVVRGPWDESDFERIEFCSDFKVEGLPNPNVTYGLGVPLIAVRKRHAKSTPTEKYYPNGLSFPVTALLRVVDTSVYREKHSGHRYHCVLELHDPLYSCEVPISGRQIPLQTDLATPLAFFLDSPQFREQADSTLGLIDPNRTQHSRGIYMLEPYDPNRIPVLMVHGLWSSPVTWMPMFNDLRSFEKIRKNYQFWFYQYPSGQPFWISATQLRTDWQQLRDTVDPNHRNLLIDQTVLVGHSMGGLVSRMQTIESGDEFWRIMSDQPFEKVKAEPTTRKQLASALFFEPNRSFRRVVTIGTPHRGSDYANDYTRWLARRFIKLPSTMVDTGHNLVRQNPDVFRDTDLLTTNTSIDSLSPKSPIFPAMLRAPRAPWTTFHNIVGLVADKGIYGKISRGSDGVVSFESAHMDDVESEIVVEAEHQNIHRTPRAILEVRRILRLHLDAIRNENVANSPKPTQNPEPSGAVQSSPVRISALQPGETTTLAAPNGNLATPTPPVGQIDPFSEPQPQNLPPNTPAKRLNELPPVVPAIGPRR